jgi:hypothetical protein
LTERKWIYPDNMVEGEEAVIAEIWRRIRDTVCHGVKEALRRKVQMMTAATAKKETAAIKSRKRTQRNAFVLIDAFVSLDFLGFFLHYLTNQYLVQ